MQYSQLYVLNDTQRGLLLLWPFCKTGVASDQCSVCVCLAYYPRNLKTKNQNLLISTKGSLSICLTLCEKMHCGSGATNFSQQTADAGVVQQHPEDSAGSAASSAPPTHSDGARCGFCHLLQDDRPPPLLVHQGAFEERFLLSFHSWCAAIPSYGPNLSFSKKTDRTVSNCDWQWKTRSHTPSRTCFGMSQALEV